MDYKRFLKNNLIKRQEPDFNQITNQLKRSLKDLKTAEANLEIDPTWSFTIAYQAMIRAGRALMYSKGFLPTTKYSHKTIVEFTRLTLGHEYHNLISRFNRMRRQRHNFIYETKNHISPHEVKHSIEAAKNLIDKIIDFVEKENPQMDLF